MKTRFLLMGISVANLHCGVSNPKVTEQEVYGITRPTYAPSSEVFHLASDQSEQTFEGSSMIFDPTIQSDTVAKIIELSLHVKSAKGQHSGFLQHTQPGWKELRERENQRKNDIAAILEAERAGLEEKSGEEQKQAINQAFDAEALEMRKRLNQLPLLTKPKFPLFCEARIWMMAASPWFLAHKFTQRPSPFIGCEAEYQKLGLLDPSVATCAADTAGKDYFACFMEEGVFKTQFFLGLVKPKGKKILNYTPEEQEKIRALYQSGALRSQFLTQREKAIKGLFQADEGGTLPVDTSDLLDNQTAQYWATTTNTTLLPSLMQERAFESESVSFHDRLFNWTMLVAPPVTPLSFVEQFSQEGENQTALSRQGSIQGGLIYDKVLSLPPSIASEEGRLLSLLRGKIQKKLHDSLSQTQLDLQTKEENFQKAVTDANGEMVKWVIERKAVISMCRDIKLSLTRTSENVMNIQAELSPTYTFSAACINATTDAAVSCKTTSSTLKDSQVLWNPVTGKISLIIPKIEDASDLCLVPDLRLGPDEQKAFLQGKQMRIELFPRKLASETYANLELLSGKIAVEDRGVKVTEGVILLFQSQEKLASAL